MKERKITSSEFLKRGENKNGLFIGANLEGPDAVKLVKLLEEAGFDPHFLDNKSQSEFSSTLWINFEHVGNSSFCKMNNVGKELFCKLMLLRPDECSIEDDGSIRLWWD